MASTLFNTDTETFSGMLGCRNAPGNSFGSVQCSRHGLKVEEWTEATKFEQRKFLYVAGTDCSYAAKVCGEVP